MSLALGKTLSLGAREYASCVESGEKLTPWKLPVAITRVLRVATLISTSRSRSGVSPSAVTIVLESGDQAVWNMFPSGEASAVIGPPVVGMRSSAELPWAGSDPKITALPSGEI